MPRPPLSLRAACGLVAFGMTFRSALADGDTRLGPAPVKAIAASPAFPGDYGVENLFKPTLDVGWGHPPEYASHARRVGSRSA